MSRVVWIINDGGHNYAKAKKFGRLRRMTEGSVNPFNLERLTKTFTRQIRLASENDFLLISGTPILTGIAMHLWLERFGVCKILQFDAKAREYEPLEITSEEMSRILRDEYA